MTSTTQEAAATLATRLAACANGDGEFRLACRYWTGSLTIDLDGAVLAFAVAEGSVSAGESAGEEGVSRHICLAAPGEVWDKVLAPIPPPFFHDISPARAFGLRVSGDEETYWQYYPAVRRLIDLLREEVANGASL